MCARLSSGCCSLQWDELLFFPFYYVTTVDIQVRGGRVTVVKQPDASSHSSLIRLMTKNKIEDDTIPGRVIGRSSSLQCTASRCILDPRIQM